MLLQLVDSYKVRKLGRPKKNTDRIPQIKSKFDKENLNPNIPGNEPPEPNTNLEDVNMKMQEMEHKIQELKQSNLILIVL